MSCHGKKSPEAKGAKLTDVTPYSSAMQPESFQMSFNEQICKIKKRLQCRGSINNNKRDDFLSPLQGQGYNIICFAAFQHEALHPPSPDSPALSFKHIVSNLCNCTVTGAIPRPHQSRLWRYGLLPNMTTPTLPMQPPCFMVKVINNTSSVQPPSSELGVPGLHPIRTGPEHCVSSDTLTEMDISF